MLQLNVFKKRLLKTKIRENKKFNDLMFVILPEFVNTDEY